MASAPQDISRSLQAFATGFHEQGKQLSELQTASPSVFQHVVLSLLLEARDTPRFRFLIAYLVSRGLLTQCAGALREVDRGLAALVAELAERMMPDGAPPIDNCPVQGVAPDIGLLLGLLEAYSTGLNLLTTHAEAIESLDGKLKARLAAILGKAARTHDIYMALVEDGNPRVRANAVESLWGSMGGMARQIFARAAKDPNHRVAANGLIGLYQQGDPASIEGLVELLARPVPEARAAAAWAMGRIGEPRFIPLLHATRRRPGQDPMVVKNCLAAVKRAERTRAIGTVKELSLRILAGHATLPGQVALAVCARLAGSTELPALRGTSFHLAHGDAPVWRYSCESVQAKAPMAVAFLLPVGAEALRARGRVYRAVLDEAFALRREADRISLALYAEQPAVSPNPLYGASELAADPADVRETLADLPGLANVPQGPFGPMEELAAKLNLFEGERNLVWLVDHLAAVFLEHVQQPSLGGVKLHVLCTARAPSAALRVAAAMAKSTGGAFLHLGDGEDLNSACLDLIASFHLHYRLTCPSPGEASRWCVVVDDGGYRGRAER